MNGIMVSKYTAAVRIKGHLKIDIFISHFVSILHPTYMYAQQMNKAARCGVALHFECLRIVISYSRNCHESTTLLWVEQRSRRTAQYSLILAGFMNQITSDVTPASRRSEVATPPLGLHPSSCCHCAVLGPPASRLQVFSDLLLSHVLTPLSRATQLVKNPPRETKMSDSSASTVLVVRGQAVRNVEH